ncbi:hypothetical protein D3C75_940880 [compost metagenome]
MHGGRGIHDNSINIRIGQKRFQVLIKRHSQLLRLRSAPLRKLIPHGGNAALGPGLYLTGVILRMDMPIGQHSNLNGHNSLSTFH